MVAWSGRLRVTTAGNYTFRLRTDDGCRLWIDGNTTPAIAAWANQSPTDRTCAAIALTAGLHEVRIEYYDDSGAQECRFSYSGPDNSNTMGVVPAGVLTPPPPPAAPTGVAASGGYTASGLPQIVVSWLPSAGATIYNVYRSSNSTGPFTTLLATVTGTSYTDLSVQFRTTYYYVIEAVSRGVLVSPKSTPPASATPQPPPPKTASSRESDNLAHRCGCDSIAGFPGWAALLAAALAALGARMLPTARGRILSGPGQDPGRIDR